MPAILASSISLHAARSHAARRLRLLWPLSPNLRYPTSASAPTLRRRSLLSFKASASILPSSPRSIIEGARERGSIPKIRIQRSP
ncbi:hypothetical protein SORBI_3009G097000 [Sorghum bicolor]|uniref:Uncharacterized protein n=1 Tax=Sorghum bicolor TaxID=4558 RepID=A0A1Z5R2T1_SORBI|nr:hypothetical protein SORBI_3009G097000 [Sorghum bicolor]